MRFSRDHLTFKALVALDEVLNSATAVPPSFALRFALAYLWTVARDGPPPEPSVKHMCGDSGRGPLHCHARRCFATLFPATRS